MDKRALMWSALLGVIAAVLAGVVLLIALQGGSDIIKKGSSKEQCMNSVRAQALLNKIHPEATVDLRCTTRYQQIDSDDEEGQKRVLAQEAADCWEMFGKGKVRLFDVTSGINSYCVVCSRLAFSKPKKLRGFTDFLFENKPRFKKETFHQYLYNTDKSRALASAYGTAGLAGQDVIDTSKDWAVLHVVLNDVDKSKGYIAYGATAGVGVVVTATTFGTGLPVLVAGGASGGTAGYFVAPYFWDEDYAATTAIIPYDELPNYQCARLEGIAGPLEFVT